MRAGDLVDTPSLRPELTSVLDRIAAESDPVCLRHLLGCALPLVASDGVPPWLWEHVRGFLGSQSDQPLDSRARRLVVDRALSEDDSFGPGYREAWELVHGAHEPLALLKSILHHISDTNAVDQLAALVELIDFANGRLSDIEARQFVPWLKPGAAKVFSVTRAEDVGSALIPMCIGNDHIGVALAHSALQVHGTKILDVAVEALSDEALPVAVKSTIASWQKLLESHVSTERWTDLVEIFRRSAA